MPAGRAGEASFGYDPLECKKCGCFMELVEIWEPQRGHVWMKRWLETHRTQYTDAVCTALCRTNWVGIAKFLIPLSPMRFLIA